MLAFQFSGQRVQAPVTDRYIVKVGGGVQYGQSISEAVHMISGNALDASLLEKLFQALVPDAFDHPFISPVFLHRVIVSRLATVCNFALSIMP